MAAISFGTMFFAKIKTHLFSSQRRKTTQHCIRKLNAKKKPAQPGQKEHRGTPMPVKQKLPRQVQLSIAEMNKRLKDPATTNDEAAKLMTGLAKFLTAVNRANQTPAEKQEASRFAA
jgi:hypothetical protein